MFYTKIRILCWDPIPSKIILLEPIQYRLHCATFSWLGNGKLCTSLSVFTAILESLCIPALQFYYTIIVRRINVSMKIINKEQSKSLLDERAKSSLLRNNGKSFFRMCVCARDSDQRLGPMFTKYCIHRLL